MFYKSVSFLTLFYCCHALKLKGEVPFQEGHNILPNKIPTNCDNLLDPDLVAKISNYQDIANNIIDLVIHGDFKGKAFEELVNFVDNYPTRFSGNKNLEDSIDYMIKRMEKLGLENVRGEQVTVPQWVRGIEEASMILPITKSIPLLGLGKSVGTSETGITASVLVVQSFQELDLLRDQVPGKIVVYNQGWKSFLETNTYKTNGASYAAQYGAVAVLIQSITPFSLNTLHTGIQQYWDNVTHIPAACITQEDADYLYRLHTKGEQILINIKMLDYNLPMTTSRNVVGELVGKGTPQEYVAVSGHIDNLDVGFGAMDDAGGVIISVMALATLKHLGLTPNRTLQAILWTSHELGLWGAAGFVQQHKNIMSNYSAVLESDSGMFRPLGLDFSGSEIGGCIVNEVLKLMSAINATEFTRYDGYVAADIAYMQDEGVPGLSLKTDNEKYFWYHHSPADTVSVIDKDLLDLNAALWTVASYVLADIPIKLPRETK